MIRTCVACDVCERLILVDEAHLVPGRRDDAANLSENAASEYAADNYEDTFLCSDCYTLERVADE